MLVETYTLQRILLQIYRSLRQRVHTAQRSVKMIAAKVFPLSRPFDIFKFPNHYEVHPRLFRQQGPANTELNNRAGNPEYDFKYLFLRRP